MEVLFAATNLDKVRCPADPIYFYRGNYSRVFSVDLNLTDSTIQGLIAKMADKYQLELEDLSVVGVNDTNGKDISCITFRRFERENGKEIIHNEEAARAGKYQDEFYLARYEFTIEKRLVEYVKLTELVCKIRPPF